MEINELPPDLQKLVLLLFRNITEVKQKHGHNGTYLFLMSIIIMLLAVVTEEQLEEAIYTGHQAIDVHLEGKKGKVN